MHRRECKEFYEEAYEAYCGGLYDRFVREFGREPDPEELRSMTDDAAACAEEEALQRALEEEYAEQEALEKEYWAAIDAEGGEE